MSKYVKCDWCGKTQRVDAVGARITFAYEPTDDLDLCKDCAAALLRKIRNTGAEGASPQHD
jgi:hypothetical protein